MMLNRYVWLTPANKASMSLAPVDGPAMSMPDFNRIFSQRLEAAPSKGGTGIIVIWRLGQYNLRERVVGTVGPHAGFATLDEAAEWFAAHKDGESHVY